MSFAKVLTEWMEREGHKHPKDVAGILGCSVATAYAYANSETLPPNTRIPALARTLGISERRLKQVIAIERSHKGQEAGAK